MIKEDLSLRGPSLTQVNREGRQDQKVFQPNGNFVHSGSQKCIDVISVLYFICILEVQSQSIFMG